MIIHAFIFARGGSKGLPGKNIKRLGHKSLLEHAIRLAQNIQKISCVWVSSDDEKILDHAQALGAKIILRPKELATDNASEWLAWQHAIDYVNAHEKGCDLFLSLPTTSPLRIKEDIERCISAYNQDCDAIITVTPANRNPYFNMVTLDEKGLSKVILENVCLRRQDAPKTYDITTVAYLTSPKYIKHNNHLFAGRVKAVVIPKQRAVDIDDEWDFKIAEAFYDEKEFL